MELTRGDKTHGHPYLFPPYGIYETEDGHVAIGQDPIDRVAEAFDVPELAKYESEAELFEHRDRIHDLIEEYTATRSTEVVVDTLVDADVQAAAVRSPQDIVDHPQAQHADMIRDIEHPNGGEFKTTGIPATHSETPGRIDRTPPEVGEHNEEVLLELGYDDDEIDAFREQNVIFDYPRT